ncbi:MAG: enoyl-CoA hydratase-related protein [Asticcacaulis sp.]
MAKAKASAAGGDLNWMKRAANQSEAENHADAVSLSKMFATANACPKPVIAIVQGAALGGGTGLAACCDIVIAHTNTLFGLTEVRLGLLAATISPFVIAKIGQSQARRYMLTAERINASTAKTIGLAHEVSDAPDEAAKPILDAILANGPDAMADSKKLIAEVAGAR